MNCVMALILKLGDKSKGPVGSNDGYLKPFLAGIRASVNFDGRLV